MTSSGKARGEMRMKIIGPLQDALVAEGDHRAVIEAVFRKPTRKGKLPCLQCRIVAGRDKGRDVDFLMPQYVRCGSPFHAFLLSVLGPMEIGVEVDPERLLRKTCVIRIQHVSKKGRVGKKRHVFANAVAISPLEEGRTERGSSRR